MHRDRVARRHRGVVEQAEPHRPAGLRVVARRAQAAEGEPALGPLSQQQVHRRDGADYVLRIAPPLDDFPSKDATVDSARVNAAIEAMVREAPSQYLWIHRRFKRRPPGLASPYRRGD